ASASASPEREVVNKATPCPIDSIRSRQLSACSLPAAGLRMMTVLFTHRKEGQRALIFSSNWGCVTSPRAKATPGCVDCLWDSDCARRDSLNRRELVCAIASDTSKDSAGPQSATWHRNPNSSYQRDALGRAKIKQYYDCAEACCRLDSFS